MRLVLFCLFPIITNSLNIIIYSSVLGQSHMSFLSSVVDVLSKRGHTIDISFAMFNDLVELKPMKGVRRNFTFGHEIAEFYKSQCPHLQNAFIKPSRNLVDFRGFDVSAVEMCKSATRNENLLNFLKSENYDIGFTNDYDPCGVIMLKAAGVPSVAGFVPTPMYSAQVYNAGLPNPISIYGTAFCSEHDESMYDKIFHLFRSAYNTYYWWPKLYSEYNTMSRKAFGDQFPCVEELERNIDIMFINSNEIIEKSKPISNKIKFIGGLGVKEPKKLPENIEKILEIPSEGVVLFSFGTQIMSERIPVDIRKNMVKAFKQFPEYTFLWKYNHVENDPVTLENVSNIHRLQWLPQTDLLYNPRVKLFISHMGLNSYLETSTAGVPVLSIPLFVDQESNAQNAADRETGVILHRDEITVENLVNALKELLTNPKYTKNAKIISKMMKEKPEKPGNLLIEWTEFAARNPGLNRMINLPWRSTFWYYSIDVLLTLLLIVSLGSYLSFKLFITFFKVSLRPVKKIKNQ